MAQETKEIDIRTWIVRILHNWYWFLLSAAIFGMYGIYSYMSTTHHFEVKSKIMLRDAETGSTFIQTDMLDVLGMNGQKSVDDEVAVLTSRDIASRIVTDLGLQSEYRKKRGLRWIGQYPNSDLVIAYTPAFLDTIASTTKIHVKVRKKDYVVKVQHGRFRHSKHVVQDLTTPFETCAGAICFNILTPTKKLPRGNQYNITIYPRPVAIDLYQKRITIAAVKKDSRVIEMSSTSDIPARSVDFMQKLIDYYNSDAMNDKNLVAQNTAKFIEERMHAVENELVQSEVEKVKYLETYGLVDPIIESELFLNEDAGYRNKLTDVATQIHMMDFLCEFLENTPHENVLLPAMFMASSSQTQTLEQTQSSNIGIYDAALTAIVNDYNALMLDKLRLEQTTDKDDSTIKQMDEQLAIMRANIITAVNNLRSTLTVALEDLEKHAELADLQRKNLPDHVRTYEKMMLEKKLKEKLYLIICEQNENNALLLASTVMPIKVITTPHITPNCVSPNYNTILILILIGLILPLGFMVVYDVMNNRISNDSKDLEKRLNTPLVGILIKDRSNKFLSVQEGDNSLTAELFRTLRTNIRFLQPAKETSSVILVTSSVNGEGKSYVAANLAISQTLLDKKVVLVDLDIRKPILATSFDLSSQGCLTSYLADESYSIEDTIIKSSIKNLDIIPAGIIPPNPSELLQSDRLDALLEELRQRYDYIILDSAPTAIVSDTFLLNRIADLTIFVTRANYTTFDLIDSINQTHKQNRLPKMVAVLNGVKQKQTVYSYGHRV